jgi:hypothetical protein
VVRVGRDAGSHHSFGNPEALPSRIASGLSDQHRRSSSVLASVIRNIKVASPAKANAIRLIDSTGREVWRARLLGDNEHG